MTLREALDDLLEDYLATHGPDGYPQPMPEAWRVVQQWLATPPSEEATPDMLTCAGCGHYIAGEYWHEGCAPPSEEATGPKREDLEWFAWFVRKSRGTVAEVTQRALDQYPDLRSTPSSEEATGLDVSRLAAVLQGIDYAKPDAQKLAEYIAAEYARLTASDGGRE